MRVTSASNSKITNNEISLLSLSLQMETTDRVDRSCTEQQRISKSFRIQLWSWLQLDWLVCLVNASWELSDFYYFCLSQRSTTASQSLTDTTLFLWNSLMMINWSNSIVNDVSMTSFFNLELFKAMTLRKKIQQQPDPI